MKSVIVCVNYNSFEELLKYLNSLQKAYRYYGKENSLLVLIADNSEKKKEVKDIYSFDLQQVFTGENLGYLGGVSYAICKSKIDLLSFDYVIISNVDLSVKENFFVELFETDFAGDIGCIAPSILSISENRDRNPKILKRYSLKKLQFLKVMYKLPALYYTYTKLFYSLRRKKVQNYKEGYIYAPHGSFMIFTKKFAPFLQKMKYSAFLFGEEIYFAENLQKMSLKTFYKPSIVVNDLDHVSTSKLKAKIYFKYNYGAIDMLIKEYYNE